LFSSLPPRIAFQYDDGEDLILVSSEIEFKEALSLPCEGVRRFTIVEQKQLSKLSVASEKHVVASEPAPAPVPVVPKPEPVKVPSLHEHRAICDSCRKIIVGTRYKCVSCSNYDYCSACYENTEGVSHPMHEFFVIPNMTVYCLGKATIGLPKVTRKRENEHEHDYLENDLEDDDDEDESEEEEEEEEDEDEEVDEVEEPVAPAKIEDSTISSSNVSIPELIEAAPEEGFEIIDTKATPVAETVTMQPTAPVSAYTKEVQILSDMGFKDVNRSTECLEKHNGDMIKAITELLAL